MATYGTDYQRAIEELLRERDAALPAQPYPMPPDEPTATTAGYQAPAMPAYQPVPGATNEQLDYSARADALDRSRTPLGIAGGLTSIADLLLTGGKNVGRFQKQVQGYQRENEGRADRYRQLADALRQRQLQEHTSGQTSLRQRYLDERQAGLDQRQDARAGAEETRAGEMHKARMGAITDERSAAEAGKQPLRQDQIAGLVKVGIPPELLAGATQADMAKLREQGFEAWAAERRAKIAAAGMAAQRMAPSAAEVAVAREQLGPQASEAQQALVQEYATTTDPKRKEQIGKLLQQQGAVAREQSQVEQKRALQLDERTARGREEYGLRLQQTGIAKGRAALEGVRRELRTLGILSNDNQVVKSGGDIPGFGTVEGLLPTNPLMDNQTKSLRGAVKQLLDTNLRAATGANAPESEVRTFREILGVGPGASDEDLLRGLERAAQYLDEQDTVLRRAYGKDAVRAYYSGG